METLLEFIINITSYVLEGKSLLARIFQFIGTIAFLLYGYIFISNYLAS